jgi:alkanesulfonate monooxygenase SsuD/methylene tetrahydromethanopterin reductase-like flavin-dependent oxidoreductase (luciferase family)
MLGVPALRLIRAMLGGYGPLNSPAPVGPLPVMVGGSGEQRLLRLVARYADMCNFSAPAGDGLADIPHKLNVLERHCAVVGRDRREITVTYKSMLVVAESETAAREACDAYRAPRGLPPGSAAFVGTPELVAGQVAAILDAGVDEVIVEVPDPHNIDALHEAGEALQMAVPKAATV